MIQRKFKYTFFEHYAKLKPPLQRIAIYGIIVIA